MPPPRPIWSSRKLRRVALLLLVVLTSLPYLAKRWSFLLDRPGDAPAAVETLHAERRSDVVVEVAGTVERLLPDDERGERHQRFILRLPSGHTLLVAHNLDLAPRVPLAVGDRVEARGEYEWNEQGGVLHWTHHDPRGRRPGGWVRLRGEEFR